MVTAKGKKKEHIFPGSAVMSLGKSRRQTWGREKRCHEVRWKGLKEVRDGGIIPSEQSANHILQLTFIFLPFTKIIKVF